MRTIKMGVIGIGNMGTKYCEWILNGEIPGMELAAVAHIGRHYKEWAKDHLNESITVFDHGEELIDAGVCEAVLIAAPHIKHVELAVRAFQKGLHVLCEKPAGIHVKEVQRMNDAAAASQKAFGLILNQRTNCIYRKMHELVHSGEFGAIKRVNWIVTTWYRPQCYYEMGYNRATWKGEAGGLLMNQAYHNLDLMQWICGMPDRITAFCHEGKWHDIEAEDDITAYMEFPGGATGVFVSSTGDAPGTNRFEISLDWGKLVAENDQLYVYKLDKNEREYCLEPHEPFAKIPGKVIDVELDGKNEQHAGALRMFAEHILEGKPLLAKGEEGIRALELCNAMYLSSWMKKQVTLPLDADLYVEYLTRKQTESSANR